MRTIMQDFRYGIKLLAKSPVFAIAAVLSLAVGIGANTAVFSLVNELFLRPLPVAVKQQNDLVRLFTRDQKNAQLEEFSYPDYVDYRNQNPAFSDILAYTFVEQFSLQSENKTEYIYGSCVSGNFFAMLGVETALGRRLTPDDDRMYAGRPVAVLSYRLWKTSFNSNPSIVGKEIRLNRAPLTVVGVAPERFTGILPGVAFDIYVPLTVWAQLKPETNQLTDRSSRWLDLVARLKPGVSLAEARSMMQTRARQLQLSYPDANGTRQVHVAGISERHPRMKIGGGASMGALLVSMTLLVLLVACANIANLLLAQAINRQREITLRAALGASRGRIMRQLLTEAIMLSLLGGAAGLLLAIWLTDILASVKLPLNLPFAMGWSLDGTVLAFTALLSMLTGLLFGSLPAIHALRLDLTSALRELQPQMFRLFRRYGARNLLLMGQIAASLVMLVMAGLMIQSFKHESRQDFGFKTDSLLMIPFNLDAADYAGAQKEQFITQLMAQIESMPGICSASRAYFPPLSLGRSRDPAFVPGYEYRPGESKLIDNNEVGRNYFKTLNIPFVSGCDFSGNPAAEVVINETMARHYWPGKEALGRKIKLGGADRPPSYVIGIVKDSALGGVIKPAQPIVYMPAPKGYLGTLVIRTIGSAHRLPPEMRRIIARLDPQLANVEMRTLSEQLDAALMQVRGGSWALSFLGLLALGLASMGLYGAVSYAVSRRTREIGICIALGAQRKTLMRRMLSEGLHLTVAGLGIGFVLAQIISHIAQSVFSGISASDPFAYLGACLLSAAVALSACYLPARRAIKADPMAALRCE